MKKDFKIIISLLCLVIIGTSFMFFTKKGFGTNEKSESNLKKLNLEENNSDSNNEKEAPSKEYDKYYIDEDIKDYANPSNKEAYKKLYDAVEEIKPEIDLSSFGIDDKEGENLAKAISNRNFYEFFYLKDAQYNKDKKIVQLTYWTDKDSIEKMKKKFNEKIDYVVNNVIKPEKSDLEKEFKLFEYLSENSKYETPKGMGNSGTYGIFVNGTGVCGDYSSAIKYILDRVGIESHRVVMKTSYLFHAINQVKIDGEYYYVDASSSKNKLLDRFNFTEAELKTNFSAKDGEFFLGNANYKKIKPPAADSDRFSFLRIAGSYFLEDGWLYYCDYKDDGKISKAELKNGKNKKVILEDSTNGMVNDGEYLYYINHSDSDYLYRVKKDGTDKKLIDNTMQISKISIKDNKLHYTDGKKETVKELPIK